MRNREYKEIKKALQYTEHIIVNKVSSFMSATASVHLNNIYLKVIGCKAPRVLTPRYTSSPLPLDAAKAGINHMNNEKAPLPPH